MEIGTKVFERIVRETWARERGRAIRKLAQVIEQTARFGCFDRQYRLKCAESLYDELEQPNDQNTVNTPGKTQV